MLCLTSWNTNKTIPHTLHQGQVGTKDDGKVSNPGSLASGRSVQGDSIDDAFEPNVETQNTNKM